MIEAIADDGDVMCGCVGTCIHAPVLEEIVLPPLRPLRVGVLSIDRAGLVAMARRRGLTDVVASHRPCRPGVTARGW